MKIPTLLLVLLVGLIPLLLFTFLIIASSVTVVAWQPANSWTAQFGPGNYENAVDSIFFSPNSLLSGGHFTSIPYVNSSTTGLFVTRYDLSGRQIWTKMFGDKDSSLSAVRVGNSVVVAGGSLIGGGFVRAFSVNGTEMWNHRFSNSTSDNIVDISVGGAGVYASGSYRLTNGSFTDQLRAFDFNGKSLWNSTISGHNVLSASSAGIYAFGQTIQLFNSDGSIKWARPLGCTGCVITNLSGDGTAIYSAGYIPGQYLFVLNKYDPAGNELWSRQLPSSYPASHTISMGADPSGIYVGIQGLNGGGTLMKFDSSGGHVWSFEIKATPLAMFAGGGALYVGGTTVGNTPQAFLTAYAQSSSFIFLGLNSPFSFGLVALVVAVVVTVVWWLKRRWPRTDLSKKPYHLLKAPKDALPLPQDR